MIGIPVDFFWPLDPTDPKSEILTYRFKVVLFGSTASQFLSNSTINYHIDKPIKITNEWVNINYPKGDTNNINQVHMHDRNVLSCVYYVQADNHCGNLTLMAPHQLYDFAVPYRYIKQPNAWNSTRFSIKPEPGKLVCFPSYLLHSADINHSNRDRISIAFNGDINET